ncbi:ThuA domain-containing protein [Opitutaceae bacterium]|nr:ThuA domain-containing protein [Opitutaceae bacterium]
MKTNTRSRISSLLLSASALLIALASPLQAQKSPKPLKVLLITGGCCHSYATQKNIIKKGLEARANVVVVQVHTDDSSVNPPLAIYRNPNYAKGYDVVIHDECAAGMADVSVLNDVLAPHRNGIPGVNLHCAMHSYRVGNHREPAVPGTNDNLWFDYLGIQSSGHGPKEPIAISFTTTDHPITKTLEDWATIEEELYNNVQVFPTAKALAKGFQFQPKRSAKNGNVIVAKNDEAVVVWTNEYHGTRVFSTTLGHFDETVADDRYLDLVTRGLLWSCKKLNDNYLK